MAKQVSGLFDSTAQDERVYTDADLSRAFRAICGSGVSALDTNLCVEPAMDGLKTRVRYGAAMCRGYFFELIDDGGEVFTLAHTAASSMPRVDRIVLRLNLDSQARSITLVVKQGNPAQTPAPPTLGRTPMVWELSLARVRIGVGASLIKEEDITDEREDDTVCGVIGSARIDRFLASAIGGFMPLADGQALQTQVTGKLDKTAVVNNLTTEGAGSALDARQGRALNTAIGLAKPTLYTHTLTSSGWTGSAAPFDQNISQAAAQTTGYLYLCYPHPDHHATFANGGIVMKNITTNGIIPFNALKKPSSNVTVYVVRWAQG
ncbi:MAG: hypothetical protein FWD25_11865 [Clostridia bacterium]|nr:hypothetical protein [Clostridia bacterium]